jgi:hypothetical protein
MNAARRFADWCAGNSISELSEVQPFHVAAFINALQDDRVGAQTGLAAAESTLALTLSSFIPVPSGD